MKENEKLTEEEIVILAKEEADAIEEILVDADAWGLRWEVEETTKKLIRQNIAAVKKNKMVKMKTLTKLQATELAYQEWVK